MSTKTPGHSKTSSIKPDDLIKPASEDGKTELSETELGGVTGGNKHLAGVKYEDITVNCTPKTSTS